MLTRLVKWIEVYSTSREPGDILRGITFQLPKCSMNWGAVHVHLRQRSVKVRTGDSVVLGQKIEEVGISGDGLESHLHFSVTDGPDMNYSQGLPAQFINVSPVGFSSTIDTRKARLFLTGEFVYAVDVKP